MSVASREEHSIAGFNRLQPQAHCEVRLPDSRRAEHDHVVAVLDVVTGGELQQLLFVDRGLVGEVDVSSGFTNGKRAIEVRMAMFLLVFAATSSPGTCSRNSA